VDTIPPIRKPRRGRLRKRSVKLHADKDYDFPRCREALRRRGIKGRIARRGMVHSYASTTYREVLQCTLSR
jgi:IS5 family transposase